MSGPVQKKTVAGAASGMHAEDGFMKPVAIYLEPRPVAAASA